MLFLNEKALIESVDLAELIKRMEKTMVFAEEGRFAMPLRSNIFLDSDDSLMLMPCVTPKIWGCKLLTLRPSNPPKGRPFINGMVALFDAETGEAKAVLEGKTVTALRTGAVGGAGIKNTAAKNISALGLVGTGVQGFWQARYGCAARESVKEVWIYDVFKDKLPLFADRLQEAIPHVKVKIAQTSSELLEKTEAVMTATNTSLPLFAEDEALLRGHAFVGIGSYLPNMKEYPDAIFPLAGEHVYVDTLHAIEETGDLITPIANGSLKRENIHTLAERIEGKCSASQPETSFFKSVGMALFDVAAAEYLCEAAAASGKGVELEF